MRSYDTEKQHDINWTLHLNADGTWPSDKIQIAVLCDIRAELAKLNALLACPNFIGIPRTLKAIERQTKKRKYVRKVKP